MPEPESTAAPARPTTVAAPVGLRRPGLTARRKRVAEALHTLICEERDARPTASEQQIRLAAQRRYDELALVDPRLPAIYAQFAPTSRAPQRRGIDEAIELAAALRQPEMQEYFKTLSRNSRSRQNRAGAIAILLALAALPELRTVRHARKHLQQTPLTRWALQDAPTVKESTVYEQIHAIAASARHELAVAANLAMLSRLRTLGHDGVLRALTVDGTKIEANVPQRGASTADLRDLLYGEKCSMVCSMMYTGSDHHLKTAWTGYKLMMLCDVASGLPAVWGLFAATVDERAASLQLLELLFSIAPQAPTEYLIGDGLYGESLEYLHDLEFAYGIHPVVPLSKRVQSAMPHVATQGVPECPHGLMRRKSNDDYATPDRRAKKNLRRGQLAEDRGRIRYVCAHGHRSCPEQTTRTRVDGRLYPYLPHNSTVDANGHHDKLFVRRQALMLLRNIAESRFAHMKQRLIGADGAARMRIRDDFLTGLVIDLYCLTTTATRLAHETGDYQALRQQAIQSGLLPDDAS